MKSKILLLSAFLIVNIAQPIRSQSNEAVNPALIYWKEFLMLADHSKLDQIESNYEKATIDEEYREVASSFDNLFRHLERTASSSKHCDWGNDFSEGPFLVLPHLMHAKRTIQIVRLRSRWHIEDEKSGKAVQEILAGFRLSRHVSQEPTLVNTLVAYALNGILLQSVAENLYGFSKEDIKLLLEGLDNLPDEGSMESVVHTEREFMVGWLMSKMEAIQKSNHGTLAEKKNEALKLLQSIAPGQEDFESHFSELSINEMITMVREVLPFYDEVPALFRLASTKSIKSLEQHHEKVEANENVFLKGFYPNWRRARIKDIGNQVRLQMLRAALSFRLHGSEALSEINDPSSNKPFMMEKFSANGVERGFILYSTSPDEAVQKQAFVVVSGPRLRLTGDRLGQLWR